MTMKTFWVFWLSLVIGGFVGCGDSGSSEGDGGSSATDTGGDGDVEGLNRAASGNGAELIAMFAC